MWTKEKSLICNSVTIEMTSKQMPSRNSGNRVGHFSVLRMSPVLSSCLLFVSTCSTPVVEKTRIEQKVEKRIDTN